MALPQESQYELLKEKWHNREMTADEPRTFTMYLVDLVSELQAMVLTLVDQVDENPKAMQYFDPILLKRAKGLAKGKS